jgi:RasGEF domain
LIIAGLNAAPICRLERSWEIVTGRFRRQLGTCEALVDPGRNFENYRHTLVNISPHVCRMLVSTLAFYPVALMIVNIITPLRHVPPNSLVRAGR